MKRKDAKIKYLGGGEVTLAPFTEEEFVFRQEGSELKLKVSWQPVFSAGQKKISLTYQAALYYPAQTFVEIKKSLELASGESLLVTESDTGKGAKDTRPVIAAVSAAFVEPVYGYARLGGIGARLGIENGYPYIIETLAESPAREAGLQFGDEITEIDGHSTLQLPMEKVNALMRGDPGTKVAVKVYKAGSRKTEDRTLIRKMLE
jgi:S1-C subfamily serine protease